MRSPTAVRQSIRLGGRTTTVTLENAFWLGLKEIARRRRIKVSDLVREIDAKREHSNFSSELRLFVLEFYRKQASLPDQRATAGGVLSEILEPIREVWIYSEAFAASRLSMMRIMARRMNAATVVA